MSNDANERFEQRRRYVSAFNSTMIKIWKERINMLGVIDTGSLLHSVMAIGMSHDSKFTSVTFSQSFRSYGLFVDYGVGSNTPKGNPGDLGRNNPRRRRKWFSRKFYASVMNTQEFFADNLGKNLADVVSNALSRGASRQFAMKVNSSAF